jgi:hypothetical protein
MGCNCGGKAKGRRSGVPLPRLVYTLTEQNGHKRSYATQAEADAARKRLGGTVITASR